MFEINEEQHSAINEVYKLYDRLTLTSSEVEKYQQYLHFVTCSGEYKRCKTCGTMKHKSEFYTNVLKSKGVFDECKECVKERTRLRRERLKLSTGFVI